MNANAHDYRLNPNVEERWISCEDCRSWMMPLAKYELEEGVWRRHEDSDMGSGSHGFGYGYGGDLETRIGAGILDMIWNSIVEWRRRRKLERLKAEVLPTHPNSQVCPKCLQVKCLV